MVAEIWFLLLSKNEKEHRKKVAFAIVATHSIVYKINDKLSLKKLFTITLILNLSFFFGMNSGEKIWHDMMTNSEWKGGSIIAIFTGVAIFTIVSELVGYFITDYFIQKYFKNDKARYLALDILFLPLIYLIPPSFAIYSFRYFAKVMNPTNESWIESVIYFLFTPLFQLGCAFTSYSKGFYISSLFFFIPLISVAFPTALWITTKAIVSSRSILWLLAIALEHIDCLKADKIKNIGLLLFTLSSGWITYLSYYK